MDILIALAAEGPLRRADITKRTGLYSIDLLHVSDKAGMTVRWRLNGKAYAMAINPWFPLERELRSVLKALARQFPPKYESTYKSSDGSVPTLARRDADLAMTFTSPLRTSALLALELLGGAAPMHRLWRSIPNANNVAVKNALKFFVQEGVLKDSADVVRFCNVAWVALLRKLLRGVIRERPALSDPIRERLRAQRHGSGRDGVGKARLFGFAGFESALTHLAVHGPSSWADVLASAGGNVEAALANYVRMGLIVSRKAGHSRIYSLNAAHPLHAPLRKLLLAMAQRAGGASRDLHVEGVHGVNRLFSEKSRTAILLTLQASRAGLDTTRLNVLLPEFDRHHIAEALRRYAELGILVAHKDGNSKVFSLDRLYQYYGELEPLLRRANGHWRQWAAAVSALGRMKRQLGQHRR